MNTEALRLFDELCVSFDLRHERTFAHGADKLRALLSAQEDDVCGVPNWAVVKAFVEHSRTPETMHACYPDRAPVFIEKVMRRARALAKQTEAK